MRIALTFDVVANPGGQRPSAEALRNAVEDAIPREWYDHRIDDWSLIYVGIATTQPKALHD